MSIEPNPQLLFGWPAAFNGFDQSFTKPRNIRIKIFENFIGHDIPFFRRLFIRPSPFRIDMTRRVTPTNISANSRNRRQIGNLNRQCDII